MAIAVDPHSRATHDVLNQPPPYLDYNAYEADLPLRQWICSEGGEWGEKRLRDLGAIVASAEADEHRRRAQRNPPILNQHDRYGHRIDKVEYDPSFDWILRLGVEHEVISLPWRDPRPGAHVVRAGLFYMLNQLDTGPCCPVAMNYAATPTLRSGNSELAARWEPTLNLPDYEHYTQAGMVMTEKQGGSDLRANTTIAEPVGDGWYELTGHKWFATHPVFDIFFTLAQAPDGLSCFLAQRPHPGFRIQRLKDKLGARSVASSEIEFDHLPAQLLGEEGRGTAVMIEQIVWTRLDTMLGTAGLMRRLLGEALWHARHRRAFGARLSDQPAMTNVLADLALESESAIAAALRVVRAFESDDASEHAFRRLALAVMKYWVCKRGPALAAEALEVCGGNGYIETMQAPVAQFYRDIQLGTVWEGSGNVIALDLLRGIAKSPEALEALLGECALAHGANAHFDRHLAGCQDAVAELRNGDPQWQARSLIEDLALALQASVLLRHAPPQVSDGFCTSRLSQHGKKALGTLPRGTDGHAIVERALAL
jgi:putative acyl-CoA dehydrogenase